MEFVVIFLNEIIFVFQS